MEAAQWWDGLMVDTAQRVLDLATHELTEAVEEALQRPRRLGGFGLSSAVLLSPFAFIASVAASAAQPGSHPLSVDTLPAASSLRQWLHAALTSPTVSALPLPSDTLHLSTANCVHLDADTFTGHYHSYPDQAAGLQSTLMTAATHSLYNAPLSEVKRAGDLRGQARLCGGRAPYASRWKTVRPTEEAYQLADEYYRYAARRDLGLPPARDVTLPRLCNACGVSVAADGRHGQRCIYNSSYTKLRHDSTVKKAKYTGVASRLGAELLNMSLDTSGGMASEAFELVRAISDEGARWSGGTWNSAAITRHLMGAIATAVQRGNALTMLSGYTRAVRAGSGAEGSGAGEEEDEACSGDVDGEE